MNHQEYFNKVVAEARKEELSQLPQIRLGKLIDLLEAVEKKDSEVYFDFCNVFPTGIDSWRGIYAELALSYENAGRHDDKTPLTVTKLLEILNKANGETFMGYKGGDYVMSRETPISVDNYGQATSTMVVGVIDEGYKVVILTQYKAD